MSVINKMLKDLDSRQDSASINGGDVPRVMNATETVTPLNKALIMLLVIIICLLGVISWKMLFSSNNQQTQHYLETQNFQQSTESTKEIDGVAVTDIIEEPPLQLEITPEPLPEKKDVVDDVSEPEPEPAPDLEPKPAPELEPESKLEPEPVDAVLAVVAEDKVEQVLQQDKPVEAKFVIQKTSSKLTPQQRVDKLLTKAKASYDRGYVTEAIEQLTRILSISDSNVEARNLLAAAWYGRGEANKAVAIINDGLQRYPLIEEWRVTAAKIFFKDNNAAGAFSYLDVNLENASKEFYTLKGNLARELKYYVKAEAAYDQLTKLEPFVGNWWLGLAIAQDSQAKAQLAAQSYQKVLEVGGVSAQSITFSQQRIKVLKG